MKKLGISLVAFVLAFAGAAQAAVDAAVTSAFGAIQTGTEELVGAALPILAGLLVLGLGVGAIFMLFRKGGKSVGISGR